MPNITASVWKNKLDEIDEFRRSFDPTLTRSEMLRLMIDFAMVENPDGFRGYVESEDEIGCNPDHEICIS